MDREKYTAILIFLILNKSGISWPNIDILCWYNKGRKDPLIAEMGIVYVDKFVVNLGHQYEPHLLVSLFTSSRGVNGVKRLGGGFAIIDSCEYHFIKEHKNLMQNLSVFSVITKWILSFYVQQFCLLKWCSLSYAKKIAYIHF